MSETGEMETEDVVFGTEDECKQTYHDELMVGEWPIIVFAEIQETGFQDQGELNADV